MIQVEEFVTDEDVSPFRCLFDALDDHAAALVTIAIDRLGEGNTSNAKSLGEGVSELRINRGPGYRVYFGSAREGACHPPGWRHQAAAAERYTDSVTPLAQLQGAQGNGTGKEEVNMPLTRSFRETVQARAHRDVKFRQALLGEAMQALLDGNLDEGRAALRSCINATIGFESSAKRSAVRRRVLCACSDRPGTPRLGICSTPSSVYCKPKPAFVCRCARWPTRPDGNIH